MEIVEDADEASLMAMHAQLPVSSQHEKATNLPKQDNYADILHQLTAEAYHEMEYGMLWKDVEWLNRVPA